MTLTLLLLLALLPQDEVTDLILKLGDEAIEVREKAAARLLKIGEPARAALLKAKDSDSEETRIRVAQILKNLDFHKEMGAWLKPPARVTLSGEMTLEEAMRAFELQSGQKVACGDWPAAQFKVDVKDVEAWTALEAICKASGVRTLQLGVDGPKLGGQAFKEVPTAVSGSFCIRFDSFSYRRSYYVDHGTESKTLSLGIQLGWGQAAVPARLAFVLNRVEDDLGNDLAEGFRKREERTHSGTPLVVPEPKPEFGRAFHLSTEELPDPKAARIVRLEGSVLLWIRASIEDVELPVVEKEGTRVDVSLCDAQLKEVSEMPVTLTGAHKRGSTLHCTLSFKDCDPRLLKETYQLWHLNDKKGRRYVGTVRSRSLAGTGIPSTQTYAIEFQNLPEGAELSTVTVRLPKRVVALEIPFVLKDIPLK